MKSRYFTWAIIAVPILIGACVSKDKPEIRPVKVSNIERVLMHEPGNFTFIVKNKDGSFGQLHLSSRGSLGVKLLNNLATDEPIRVEYMCKIQCKDVPENFSAWFVVAKSVRVYIHSAKDINGAGWNHGKHGRGQTEVIE